MVSDKLKPFLAQVNEAITQAKRDNVIVSPELVRTNLDKLSALVTLIPEINNISNTVITDKTHQVPVRIYTPDSKEKLDVLLYFHGGGHMCGSVALYDPMCRKIALASNCIVISVEYRLAPEFPYPAGINDAQLVLENYTQVLTSFNFSSQLYIAGDSAGGAICATLSMNNIDNEKVNIDKQILIYPSLDYTMSLPSISENGQGYLLESQKVAWYFDHYFQNKEDRKQLSPLFASIESKLPVTLIFTAGYDPLRDEGFAYVEKLKSGNTPVQHTHFKDMVHAFMNIEDLVQTECEQLFQEIGLFTQTE